MLPLESHYVAEIRYQEYVGQRACLTVIGGSQYGCHTWRPTVPVLPRAWLVGRKIAVSKA